MPNKGVSVDGEQRHFLFWVCRAATELSDIMESIRTVFKDVILPEIDKIKEENVQIKTAVELTNKRLDDINTHLADQSRRIDAIREELSQRIDEINKRIDDVRGDLTKRIDETNKRVEQMGNKFDNRMNQLYEVIVRRDEHSEVVIRVTRLEQDMHEIKQKMAAWSL